MQNPQSYVASNIAGFVNLLEVAKTANPQTLLVGQTLRVRPLMVFAEILSGLGDKQQYLRENCESL